MKKYTIHIFYGILILVAFSIYLSAQYQKRKLAQSFTAPRLVLEEISNNYRDLLQQLDTIYILLPDQVLREKPDQLIRPLTGTKQEPDVSDLSNAFRSFRKLDSVLNSLQNGPLIHEKEFLTRVAVFHRKLSETEAEISRYDSLAIRINYQLKKFPRNIYVNLFKFEVLPLFHNAGQEDHSAPGTS